MKLLACFRSKPPRPDSTEGANEITGDMIVKDVVARWPQTVAVFGQHKVDFCCGGAHSIEQTARARGCADVVALVRDLNAAIGQPQAAPHPGPGW